MLLPFEPFPFLWGSHLQTIVGSLLHSTVKKVPSEQKIVQLPDKDQLSLEVCTPSGWMPTDLTVALIHGLCGSAESSYLIRTAHRLNCLNIRTVRFNLRGCGSGRGLAKKLYHSGRSEDALIALSKLKQEQPKSPIALIGFSLGANLVLKLCGEYPVQNLLKQVIAVSPPADLHACVKQFDIPTNWIYERYFCRKMRTHIEDLYGLSVPKIVKMREFDEMFTAPRSGFRDALDYYTKNSCAPYVPAISIPCKVLFSQDDPFVVSTIFDEMALPSNIEIYKTKKGGHMGYFGHPFRKHGIRWLDSQLVEWLEL